MFGGTLHCKDTGPLRATGVSLGWEPGLQAAGGQSCLPISSLFYFIVLRKYNLFLQAACSSSAEPINNAGSPLPASAPVPVPWEHWALSLPPSLPSTCARREHPAPRTAKASSSPSSCTLLHITKKLLSSGLSPSHRSRSCPRTERAGFNERQQKKEAALRRGEMSGCLWEGPGRRELDGCSRTCHPQRQHGGWHLCQPTQGMLQTASQQAWCLGVSTGGDLKQWGAKKSWPVDKHLP